MADANTSIYKLIKPEVGASADTWGSKLNSDLDYVDAVLGAKATTGSANAYVLTTSLSLSAYATGQSFLIIPNFTNTGAATINVDGLGAKAITKVGANALDSGDLVSGQVFRLVYDGTQFQIVDGVTNALDTYNAIINGDFDIWQRGTSFSSIASNAYFADRFWYAKSGAVVHDITRSTDVPTVAQAGYLLNYSAYLDVTTADASIAAGDLCFIQQNIEGFNWRPLAQRIFTLSFWVKGTKTGIHCISFRNWGSGTPDRSYIAEYTINTTNTWEFKTVTVVTAPPSAGTWDYGTNTGLSVAWILSCGSTYQTTANAWQTGNYLATANQVNATDSTSNDFRLAGVRLVAGSVAKPLVQRPYSQELVLCQRYYARSVAEGESLVANTGAGFVGTSWGNSDLSWGTAAFPVIMRTTPTVTIYDGGGTSGSVFINSANANASGYVASSVGRFGFSTVLNLGAGIPNGYVISAGWEAAAEL